MAKKSPFSGLSPEILAKRKKLAEPSFIDPMLATLTDKYFSSKDWIYEHKFDGERCLAFKKHGKVTIKSRNKRVINDEYPELVIALTQQPAHDFVIDGEIIAVEKKGGLSDFQLLQGRINLRIDKKIAQQEKNVPIYYQIFDIMYADGYDIRELPLLARKKILKNTLNFKGVLKYSDHRSTEGLKFFKEACKLHWEGLIAKRAKSTYQGIRSRDWLKFKCVMEQELVIIGYTEPKGSRTDFGALLVGYYKGKKLMYAGKVGTGFNQEVLKMLGARLRKLKTSTSHVSNYTLSTKDVHWVKPKLVAEFKFAEWTRGGRLRVGRYKGMRDDKKAHDVVKEVPTKK